MNCRVWIQQKIIKITILWVNHRHCSCLHVVITVDFHWLDWKYFLDRTRALTEKWHQRVSFVDENVTTDDTWNKLHEKLLRPAILSRKIKSSKESLNIALSLYTGILSVPHISSTIFCHLFHAWAKGDLESRSGTKSFEMKYFVFLWCTYSYILCPFWGHLLQKGYTV